MLININIAFLMRTCYRLMEIRLKMAAIEFGTRVPHCFIIHPRAVMIYNAKEYSICGAAMYMALVVFESIALNHVSACVSHSS